MKFAIALIIVCLCVSCGDNTVAVRCATLTDLHQAINRKFNEEGIVIAFPQRDLHLNTNSPLEVRMLQGTSP